MNFRKNAEPNYAENGIAEENGWVKWRNWQVVRRHIGYINYILTALIVMGAFIFREYFAENGIIGCISAVVAALVAFYFVVTPVHEMLHLIVFSKGRLDDKCIITWGKGTVSALYDGITSRNQYLLSLLLPFLVLIPILLVAVFLTGGWWRMFFIFLSLCSALGCYTDIYMFFYCFKHIKSDELVYELYKKAM